MRLCTREEGNRARSYMLCREPEVDNVVGTGHFL